MWSEFSSCSARCEGVTWCAEGSMVVKGGGTELGLAAICCATIDCCILNCWLGGKFHDPSTFKKI